MFPSNDDQFGGAAGGPPPADAMFESFLNDSLDELEESAISTQARESEILEAGLQFIVNMKAMR